MRFQGYSKKLESNGTYTLNPQIRRIQFTTLQAGTLSSTITRADIDKKFYVSSVHIDLWYSGALQNPLLRIYDSNTTNNLRIRFQYFVVGSAHFDLDFTSAPREFTSNYITFVADNLDAPSFMHIVLIGWAE